MTNEEFRHSFKVAVHNSLGLAVYSCGIQRCGSLHSWGPAVRDHYLIHYVISGRGVFTVAGRSYDLSVGDGFLLEPSRIASYTADENDPWEYCWVGFNGSDAKRLMSQTGLLNTPVFHYDKDQLLFNLMENIRKSSGSSPSEEARMVSGLLKFLAALMDIFGNQDAQHATGFEYVQKAIKYIDYNFSRDIDVNEVAASAGISRSHLYRLFMQHISMPPNEYLMRFRISKGVELLENKKLSVGEVAYSTGFSDQLYFSRVFKKIMGIPPSKYAGTSSAAKKEDTK